MKSEWLDSDARIIGEVINDLRRMQRLEAIDLDAARRAVVRWNRMRLDAKLREFCASGDPDVFWRSW